jgi:murein DD-endopeptidase MepM/ murein hydrolase activator NlpD
LLLPVLLPKHRPEKFWPRTFAGLALAMAALATFALTRSSGEVKSTPEQVAAAPLEEVPQTMSPPTLPSPPKTEPVHAVAGWVIDSQGDPMVGVAIHRLKADRSPAALLGVTDAEGAYRLSKPPADGEELLMRGDAVFASTFRHGGQEKGMRVMGIRRVSLSARVVYQGAPVARAQVELHDGSGPTGRILETDSEGLVRFEELVPGAYEVWARGQGLASRVVREARLSPTSAPLSLELESAGSGFGKIVDAQGQGLAASIRLLPASGDYAARQLQTSEDGSFAVEALLPGRWQVEVQAVGYVRASDFFVEASAAPLDFKVEMQRGGIARGTVVDENGRPVPNARVVLRSQSQTRKIATASAMPAEKAMRWVHPLATKRAMPGHASRRFGAGRDGVRPTECGRGHCGVDIGSQRGRVVHAAGAARVVKVLRESKGKAGRYIVLEHQGGLKSFYMHLDEIHADLAVGQQVQAGDPIASIGRTGVIRSGPHLHFSISQNHGGRTWFIDPEPILQHAVVLPEPGELGGRRIAATSTLSILVASEGQDELAPARGDSSQTVLVSDHLGRFRRQGLAAGRYTASAYHDSLAPGTSSAFSVSYGQESNEVIVRLQAGVEIFGVVRGPNGPIADALIVAEESGSLVTRSIAKTHADSGGRYRLRPLSGRLSLRVSAPGYGEIERRVDLAGGQGNGRKHSEEFSLAARDQRLEGQIRDSGGFPVRGASIRILSGPSARGARTTSDEYGNFLIPNLSRGSYRLSVLSEKFPTASKTITTEGTHEIRLVSGGAIHFRLVDAHNRNALAGVRVDAVGPKQGRSSVVTDQDGVALFPKLGLGAWTLRVRQTGYVAQETRIIVEGLLGGIAHQAEHTAELSRGASLAGILRDHDGDRVAAARVFLGSQSTVTDQDGRFRLSDVGTGAVRLRAEHDGESGELDLELSPGDEIVTLDIRLE